MSLSSFFFIVKWFHLFQSNTNTQLNVKIVLFQAIQFSISTQFFAYTQSNDQTVLFQTIWFSMLTKLNELLC